MERHRCKGYPQGHDCPVEVAQGDIYCSGCRRLRQQELSRGIPTSFVGIGTVLDDFEAPLPNCVCGGDPMANNHALSLSHREFEWRASLKAG